MQTDASPFAFERGVEIHVYGTLFAWMIGLLAYLMYQLWQDYISTIVSAFVLSQTLHRQRAYLVQLVQQLRASDTPLLYEVLGLFTRPLYCVKRLLFDLPPLMQLAMLLALFFFAFSAVSPVASSCSCLAFFSASSAAAFASRLR